MATMLQRARGCTIGHMIGDTLGAAFEGLDRKGVQDLCRSTWGNNLVQGHMLAVPMGTYVPDGAPGTYRPATGVSDSSFVPTGPPTNEQTAQQCARIGHYTDDTNACLALASSIVECGRVDAQHAAQRYATFTQDNEHYRGCPPTAKAVMHSVLEGVPIQETGLPPYFPFPGGSFANGGAMRISLLAIAYRNAELGLMAQAVTQAILSSHRHPEAIDFAVVQAVSVQYALGTSVEVFSVDTLLARLNEQCKNRDMKVMLNSLTEALRSVPSSLDEEYEVLTRLVGSVRRPGSGMGFQIASIHMMPCVLWVVSRHYREPRLAVQVAIDIGGDTDTCAAMVGAIMGALHGEAWYVDWAAELENGPHGRDYALGLAEGLVGLDVRA